MEEVNRMLWQINLTEHKIDLFCAKKQDFHEKTRFLRNKE